MSTNDPEFEPTREDLLDASAKLYGEVQELKRAGFEVHEHAMAYREMLMMIHEALRAKEETGAELTETEARIRFIVGSPEVTQAGAEGDE